jgi:hypothetical protein
VGGESDNAKRESARDALGSLTRIERLCCGALISRQLDHGPKIPSEFDKYGPEGVTKLCSTRAITIYILLVWIIVIPFGLIGVTPVGIVGVPLVSVLVVLGVMRGASAARAGRKWRSSA